MNSYWSIVGQDAKRQINQLQKIGLTITERILAKSHYYEVAREFGRLCVARVGATGYIATCSTCWDLDHDNLATFGLAQTALTASL
jgi:hypothetical protein